MTAEIVKSSADTAWDISQPILFDAIVVELMQTFSDAREDGMKLRVSQAHLIADRILVRAEALKALAEKRERDGK